MNKAQSLIDQLSSLTEKHTEWNSEEIIRALRGAAKDNEFSSEDSQQLKMVADLINQRHPDHITTQQLNSLRNDEHVKSKQWSTIIEVLRSAGFDFK